MSILAFVAVVLVQQIVAHDYINSKLILDSRKTITEIRDMHRQLGDMELEGLVASNSTLVSAPANGATIEETAPTSFQTTEENQDGSATVDNEQKMTPAQKYLQNLEQENPEEAARFRSKITLRSYEELQPQAQNVPEGSLPAWKHPSYQGSNLHKGNHRRHLFPY
jgi:acetyl/propionyl-CoA carboxylase alpha subunit